MPASLLADLLTRPLPYQKPPLSSLALFPLLVVRRSTTHKPLFRPPLGAHPILGPHK